MSELSKKLSATIITKDEEENIARALKSVEFVDEVVIVDAESKDRTVEIAKSLGAKVFINPWLGYGAQRNLAASHASGDWILVIDADEQITAELAKEISEILANPKKDFYWFKIVTVFLNRPLYHLYGYNLRLFKKSAGQYGDMAVHEQIQTYSGQRIKLRDPLSEVLENPLMHYSHSTFASYLKSMKRYTTLDAQEMAKENRHRSGRAVQPTWWLPYHLFSRQFIKMYFYKKGFLDGYAGFMWCLLSAYYEYRMAQKYLKLSSKFHIPNSKF